MGQIQFSMNGFRSNLRGDMHELRHAIACVLEDVCKDEKDELIDKFDQVACSINSLNYVWVDGMDGFKDMSDAPEIELLGNYDD